MLVEFDIVTVDVTDSFWTEWLDKVEKEFGVRPVIYEKLVATEEVKHHVCSMTPSAQAFVVNSELANYHELEEAGGDAEQIEQDIASSYDMNGRFCDYYNYYEFWKTDFVERERGGLFNYDEMGWGDAVDMARGETDIDDLEWATEDEKKQMEDYWRNDARTACNSG